MVSSIMFTHLTTFERDGMTNVQLCAYRNPHCTINDRHHHLFKNMVWDGNVDDCLMGQYVFPARLTGAVYMGFISNTRPDKLEDITLLIRSACRSGMVRFQHIYSHYSR